mmetsp:Transcript_36050/g.108945  ORF Transcript_36050/g.108945 Transcript_36050/m.108945 type:complete len:450 (-) Transcript_36050:97-1446(-)
MARVPLALAAALLGVAFARNIARARRNVTDEGRGLGRRDEAQFSDGGVDLEEVAPRKLRRGEPRSLAPGPEPEASDADARQEQDITEEYTLEGSEESAGDTEFGDWANTPLPGKWTYVGEEQWQEIQVAAESTFMLSPDTHDPDDFITSWSVAASPEGLGQYAFTTDGSGKAVLWDITGGRISVKHSWRPHAGGIRAAAFTIADKQWRFLTVGWDDTAILSGFRTRASAWEVLKQQAIQPAAITSAAFSPDGKHALLAPVEDGVMVWTFKTGETQVQCKREGTYSAAMSPDGTRLVSGTADGTVIVWTFELGGSCVQSEVLYHHLEIPSVVVRNTFSIDFSPDQRLLTASNFGSGLAKVWDFGTQTVRVLPHENTYQEDVLKDAAFSADGVRVVTAQDDLAYVWNLQDGTRLKLDRHENFEEEIWFARISPDGSVVFAMWGGHARTWRL